MSKPFKFNDIQSAVFWNDTHKLTLILEPLPVDPPVEPPVTIELPTDIKLEVIEYDIEINTPTNIKLKEI